jgi:fructose-1,6-bisphosphatase II / sedoheptulose-1,7-bisphosphatase
VNAVAALSGARADQLRSILLHAASKAAARSHAWRGKGDKDAADAAAVDAVREVLLASGHGFRVVSGEGLLDQAPRFDQGEHIGSNASAVWDMAIDPLDGTSLCAADLPGAICALGIAEAGTLLPAPDMYMWKLMAGPDCPAAAIRPDASISQALAALANARGTTPDRLTVSMLDRKRHATIREEVERVGAGLRLIDQGDLLAAHWVCSPHSGVDLHIGIGGAPEGVISAMILKALGGQMAARLLPRNDGERQMLASADLTGRSVDALSLDDIVAGNAIVAIASVTGTDCLAPVLPFEGELSVEAQTWSTLAAKERAEELHRLQEDVGAN